MSKPNYQGLLVDEAHSVIGGLKTENLFTFDPGKSVGDERSSWRKTVSYENFQKDTLRVSKFTLQIWSVV